VAWFLIKHRESFTFTFTTDGYCYNCCSIRNIYQAACLRHFGLSTLAKAALALFSSLVECPAYMSDCSQAHIQYTTLSRALASTVMQLWADLELSKVTTSYEHNLRNYSGCYLQPKCIVNIGSVACHFILLYSCIVMKSSVRENAYCNKNKNFLNIYNT
jgi:hypothetical protein